MNYLELCETAVRSAERAGAEEAEALLVNRHSIGTEIERAEIKTCAVGDDSGVAVRAAIGGKIGFAYTNMLTKEAVVRAAAQATEASAASLKDKNWKQLPNRREYPTVGDVFDRRVTRFTAEEAVSVCEKIMTAAVSVDKRVLPALGGVEATVQKVACVNSHGVEVVDEGTGIICVLGAIARSDKQVTPVCVEFTTSRTLDLDPNRVGSQAAQLAVRSLNVGKAEPGKFPVLLDSLALESLFTYTLIPPIRGDNVARENSALADKIGEKIAGDNISLYDDGTLRAGLHSGKTDMEGVPRQKTPIVEDGVLTGFLYDNYWARVQREESTGNASRGGGRLLLPPYGTLPSIRPSNVTFKIGTATDEEMIAEVHNGYYVRDMQGAHQSNPDTGEFSVVVTPAWRILDGELSHAVKGVMIAGNFYEMVQKISVVGRDTRQINTFLAPKVVVSELNVITK